MKQHFHLFRLAFERTLHLGKGTDFYDRTGTVLHSDTLYAALTDVAAQAGVLPEQQPDFALTSAFPFVRHSDQFEYFFPRIVLPKIKHEEQESTPRKTLKNLRWLNKNDFETAISGKDLPDFDALKNRISEGYLFENKEKVKLPFKKQVSQRVKVSRTDEDALPFYVESLFFEKGSGFFVLAQCTDQTAVWLEKVFKILGANGIGTDRNVGYGQFEVERDILEITLPDTADAISNLSLYLPADKEELAELLKPGKLKIHRLIERGGWISSEPYQTLRKHSVTMLEEGGIFFPVANETTILGKTMDIAPKNMGLEHPILRCGKAVFIPVRLTENQ